ncbi:MAG: amino acid permease [Candidatus Caenarcaniphilales bacterium]|nr:amino acid permease [Candidatus Caenarcaniphilales bacterium]
MFWKNICRTKSLDAAAHSPDVEEHQTLSKVLNVKDLTAIGIAAIIGAGVFSSIGRACFNGGPAVSLLFVFTAITCAFCALCYAEFASRVPVSGSAYTYAYVTFGELAAWIIGWNLIMEYAIGNITVAIAWSSNLTSFLGGLGIHLPSYLTTSYMAAQKAHAEMTQLLALGKEVPESVMRYADVWQTAPLIGDLHFILNIPAFVGVSLITALVYVGIKESKNMTILMVAFKVIVVLFVIIIGAFYVNPANWVPFAPNGLSGVMKGVSAVFFAYIGFDAVSTAAEECKDPQRDLPKGMIYSLLICTGLYVAISVVLTGMVNYTKLNVGDFLVVAFQSVGLNWLGGILALSAVIATTSVLLVFQLAQPRIWMVMGRDGLLPKKFAEVHPKFRTPAFATLVMGFMVAFPALFLDAELATDMNSIGTLFAFAAVCAGILLIPKDSLKPKFSVPYVSGKIWTPMILLTIATVLYWNDNNIFANLFSFASQAEFEHNLPYIVFIGLAILVSVLSYLKNLSLIPVLGLLSCLYLMTELGVANWIRFFVWMFVGVVIYLAYGYKNSKLNK